MKRVMTWVGTLILMGVGFSAQSQDVNYLDSQMKETKKRQASFVRELTELGNDTYSARITSADGWVKCEGIYVFLEGKFMEHGEFVFYYPSGQIESKGKYEYGVKVGSWERYTTGGTRKADRFYDPESANLIRNVMKQ